MMDKRKSDIKRIVDELLLNSLTGEEVLKQWPSGNASGPLEEALIHQVRHFTEDVDIRSKDLLENGNKDYENFQKDQIRACLDRYLA